MDNQTIGRARVARFYPGKANTGFGFLAVRGYPKGLFFHTENGRKMNPEGTGFLLDQKEVVIPSVDQVLLYSVGEGRRGPEAIPWAFAPDGSGLI